MTVYSEGPFRQWTAVHWPESLVIKYEIQNPNNPVRQGRFTIYEDGLLVSNADPAKFQKVLTGKQSGVSVDFRNVPIDDPASTEANPPDCEVVITGGGIYTYPSGALITGPAPWKGASIKWEFELIPGVLIIPSSATIICHASHTPNAEETACLSDDNAPPLDAFIDGEEVTASDPDE